MLNSNNPESSSLKIFTGQVAGHGQILQLPNGSLVKPSCPVELAFYQIVKENNLPLINFMPECYNFDDSWEEIKKKYIPNDGFYINMENLILPFEKPNIIDLKLGTRLYDDNANEAKREKMILNASSTTSLKTGLKICGLQIRDNETNKTMKIGKDYGRKLTPNNLPQAILRFLLSYTNSSCYHKSDLDKEEQEMDQSVFIHPDPLALKFISLVLKQVVALQQVIEQCPVRIYGCSLCLIFDSLTLPADHSHDHVHDHDHDHDHDTTSPHFSIHLIDFAHSTCVDPELGVDTCLMTGINTLIRILQEFLNRHLAN